MVARQRHVAEGSAISQMWIWFDHIQWHISNMSYVQNFICLPEIRGVTVSVPCRQNFSLSNLTVSSSLEKSGPWSLTFNSHSFPLRLSSSQTHGCRSSHKMTPISQLVCRCVLECVNLSIWMCAWTVSVRVCVCVYALVANERHATVCDTW